MIKRILDPNPVTRITVAEIKADQWFKQGYVPLNPDDDEDNIYIDEEAFSINDEVMVKIDPFYSIAFPCNVTCILWRY